MTHKRKPNILSFDIESLPNQGYFFQSQTKGFSSIPLPFIKKTHSIISIAYKFYGSSEKGVIKTSDFPKVLKQDPYNDRLVVKKFIDDILPRADYTVAHYGDAFDTKMIATRCLLNDLMPPPIVQTIDTYKLVKKHFKLNTNKLDHLGFWLGVGVKHPMGAQDWVGCAEGDVKAIEKMAKYNLQDVLVLEKIFDKILPYVDHKISMKLFSTSLCCDSCESDAIQFKGTFATKSQLKQRYQCQDCGKWGHMTDKKFDEYAENKALGKFTNKILKERKDNTIER